MTERTWKRIDLEETGPYVNMNNGYPCCVMSYMNGEKCWVVIPCFSIGSDGKGLSPRRSKPEDACEILPEWAQHYKDSALAGSNDENLFCYEIRFGKWIGLVAFKHELTIETVEDEKRETDEWRKKRGLK